jgi:very-long-chain ceramide synthase
LDSIIVGPYYIMFMGIWIYLRHWINWKILWATLTEFRTVGPFELNWETQQYKCWISQYITFSLLACLQAVNLFWLFLILRIAKNYVFADELGDERSDDEEEEEDETHAPAKKGTKALESAKDDEGSKPVVLINGEPVEGESKVQGARERKRRG